MLRVAEDLRDRSLLDDLALDITQTRSAILRTMPRSWVMKSIDMLSLLFRLGEELQDLRLHRHVERRGRLVGDEEVGLVGERHGDHHALALAARELVRVGAELAPRRGCRRVRSSSVRVRASRSDSRRCSFRISPTCRSMVWSG